MPSLSTEWKRYEFTLTTGKIETKDTYRLRSWIGKTYTSNSLDEESDLVPGQWTFEVWFEGKKLCEQSFLVALDENKKPSTKSGTARMIPSNQRAAGGGIVPLLHAGRA